jgi:predicted kinase
MPKKIPETPVVVFFGLSGSGKSYLAGRWAVKHNWCYLNSDEVRKQLAGVAPDSRHHVPFNEGLYSPGMTRRTYRELHRRAAENIGTGCAGVVLDGSYGSAEQRHQVVDSLGDVANIYFILCYCSESVTRQRFSLRAEDSAAVSDGRWEIYVGQKKRFATPERIAGASLYTIDTDDDIDTLIARVDRIVHRTTI